MSETPRLGKKDGRANRWTAGYARAVVERWRASGQSAVAFAAQHGINASRLSYWSKQIEQPQGEAAATFIAVPVEAANASRAVEIVVGGLIVRVREGVDARYVAQLVNALRSAAQPC